MLEHNLMSNDYTTLNLPRTPGVALKTSGSERKLEEAKGTLEVLCSVVDAAKLRLLPNEAKTQLQALLGSFLETRVLEPGTVQVIQNCLRCERCGSLKTVPLACGCALCECACQRLSQTANNSSLAAMQALSCPTCQKNIQQTDLPSISNVYKSLESQLFLQQVTQSIHSANAFLCPCCKKYRGKALLAENTCKHMCKVCIARQYHTNKARNCVQCGMDLELGPLSREQHPCSQCRRNWYLIGDRMEEREPNRLLCVQCMFEQLDSRAGFVNDRAEICDYIVRQCCTCFQDQYIDSMMKNKCCNSYMCRACYDQDLRCRACE
jgi:hypothetical protein